MREALAIILWTETGFHWVLSPFGLFTGLGLIYVGFQRFRTRLLIDNTTVENARSVAVGRTALQGTVRPAVESYRAPFTDEECVYVFWKIEERRRLTDEEDDAWVNCGLGWEVSLFSLSDDTGEVLVDPSDTGVHYEFDEESTREITVPAGEQPPPAVAEFLESNTEVTVDPVADPGEAADVEPGYWDGVGKPIGPHEPVSDTGDGETVTSEDVVNSVSDDEIPVTSDRKRRYSQEILPVGSEVYVFGSARPHEALSGVDQERLLVGGDPETGMFLVSQQTEDPLSRLFERAVWSLVAVGLLVSAVSLWVLLAAFV